MPRLIRDFPTNGNTRTWTWAGWVKRTKHDTAMTLFDVDVAGSAYGVFVIEASNSINVEFYNGTSYDMRFLTSSAEHIFEEHNGWAHFTVRYNSALNNSEDRLVVYCNGERLHPDTYVAPQKNLITNFNQYFRHHIGYDSNAASNNWIGSMSDLYFVDGQALEPTVFGFFKDGSGSMSGGNRTASNSIMKLGGKFSPRMPSHVKTIIESRGGFGVNGYYLPCASGQNPGADFHVTPDTILKINSDKAQPLIGEIDSDPIGSYTDIVRDDEYSEYLELAIPFIENGLSDGYGDYSGVIKNGTAKTITGTIGWRDYSSLFYTTTSNFNGSTNEIVVSDPNSNLNFAANEDFTIEVWVHPTAGGNGTGCNIFGDYGSTNSGGLQLALNFTSKNVFFYQSSYINQTPSNSVPAERWTHIAVERYNGTITTYINGAPLSDGVRTGALGNQITKHIGADYPSGSQGETFQGFMNDLRVYKGVAKYKGGFDCPKIWHWSGVGGGQHDVKLDTPTNTFATFEAHTAFDGDTGLYTGTRTTTNDVGLTLPIKSGKYYVEWWMDTASDTPGGNAGSVQHFGLSYGGHNAHLNSGGIYGAQNGTSYIGIRIDNRVQGGSNSYYGVTNANHNGTPGYHYDDDVVGMAYDIVENGNCTVQFYRNGVETTRWTFTNEDYALFIPYARTNGYIAILNAGQDHTFHANMNVTAPYSDENGIGKFRYPPPPGHLALCTQNLNTPINDPSKHFGVTKWTGDSSRRKTIGGLNFKPDLVLVKRRDASSDGFFQDIVRGWGPYTKIAPSSIVPQNDTTSLGSYGVTDPRWGYVRGAHDGGFTVSDASAEGDQANKYTAEYVAWCWKGGEVATNNDGTVESTVSANVDAGFSICEFSTGSNPTTFSWGHGLLKSPQFILLKGAYDNQNNAYNWDVYHQAVGNSDRLILNSTGALNDVSPAPWNDTDPDSNVVYQNNSYGGNGEYSYYGQNKNCIAYCWHEIEGYSRFGNYYGNGTTEGPFVYTGFRPAMIILKEISGVGSWNLIDTTRDPKNPNNFFFAMNTATGDDTGAVIQTYSNGFRVNLTSGNFNDNNVNYSFAAFAESPLKHSYGR